ncbi:MAG: hypothetical protein WA058_00455 [Minisyncoccia bacterium]
MGYPFDPVSVATFLRVSMQNGWCVSVVEDGDEIIGLCGVMIVPHYANFAYFQATEFVWHSIPSLSHLKRAKAMILMLEEMERFAENKKLKLSVSTSTNFPSLAEFMEKRKYVKVESVYAKEN